MVELIENEIMERGLTITWEDIAGLEFAKKSINEIIIWPMLRPDIFKGIRAPPRGILFFGPPGTGKTLLGKAIASQIKSTFMSISASTLTSKWVGEGEKMVRTMFAIAAIHQPTVIFIDEIDSLLCSRNENDMESSRRIKTEFLVQLDGANTFAGENARILIIGATNRPDDLDEAVKRRMAKRLYIPLPNFAGRKQYIQRMIEHETKRVNEENASSTSADDVSYHINLDDASVDELVRMTKGYSGADLKTLVAEAAMIPLRSIDDIANVDVSQIRPLNLEDFREALKNVKATVNQNDLRKFMEWNDSYGSFPIREEDLKD
jgi:fidgetin-like protein 1